MKKWLNILYAMYVEVYDCHSCQFLFGFGENYHNTLPSCVIVNFFLYNLIDIVMSSLFNSK
jgi:hypothetical protein